MPEDINPLEYHYQTSLKLDYFIFSADIALLGWTAVKTDWLPKQEIFYYLMGGFWILIILSVISGVIRQLYNGMAFGINYQYLNSGQIASQIERVSMEGGNFIDQQTKEVKSSEEFGKYATGHRETEKRGKEIYKKLSNKSTILANLSIIFLFLALILLVVIRFLMFQ